MKRLLFVAALVCVVSAVSFAQLGLYSIGGGVGFVSVQNEIGGGISFGAGADLGELTNGLRLRPEIGYWSVSKEEFGFDYGWSNLVINANAIYAFRQSAGDDTTGLGFYAGAGLGLNNVSVSADVPGFGSISSSESRIGINLLAGGVIPVAPRIMVGAEARYVIVSDFGHFGVQAIIVYSLR